MVLFNYSTKELTAKVVYYGPGLCGKTTNLQWIHEKLPIKNKGKMLSLATETDRTLFFDFLPIELGSIRGMKTRIQLYTVPGQVFYNATRRMVLKGADCVVFVCDSQEAMLEANLESMENLRQNLEANEIDPDEIPTVLQYNKRDLPNALPLEILNERLNPRGTPFYEAVALKGQGVEETLKGVTGLVFRSLASKYGGGEAGTNPPPATTTAPRVTPAAVPAAPKPAPPPRPAPPPEPAPPPPVARAEGRPAGTSTLPPLNIAGPPPADDLLDSLELRPATENADGAEQLLEVELEEPAEEIETLSLEEEPIEPPAPSPAARPVASRPEPARDDPRSTLVRGAADAEDLRRRIARPVQPEMELEEFAEEEIEEINLDNTGPFPAGAPAQSTETLAVSEKDRLQAALVPPRAAPAAARTAPPPPAPDTARIPTLATPPVSVRLSPDAGETHVSIPVEVTLADGEAHVTIHLRLALNLKLH